MLGVSPGAWSCEQGPRPLLSRAGSLRRAVQQLQPYEEGPGTLCPELSRPAAAPHQTLGSPKPGVIGCDAKPLCAWPPPGPLRVTPTSSRMGMWRARGPVIGTHTLSGVVDLFVSEPVVLCPQMC